MAKKKDQFFCYNADTRLYVGKSQLSRSDLDPVGMSADHPNGLTIEPPRAAGANEVIIVNEQRNGWEYVSDYRGDVYNKQTREKIQQNSLGALPSHLTATEPATPWDVWDDKLGLWETDAVARSIDLRQQYCQMLDQFACSVRSRFLSGGDNCAFEFWQTDRSAKQYRESGYAGAAPPLIKAHMSAFGVDGRTAVKSIETKSADYDVAIIQIRVIRLQGKAEINSVVDVDDVSSIYETYAQKLDAIGIKNREKVSSKS